MSIQGLKERVGLAFVRLLLRLNLIGNKGAGWEDNDE